MATRVATFSIRTMKSFIRFYVKGHILNLESLDVCPVWKSIGWRVKQLISSPLKAFFVKQFPAFERDDKSSSEKKIKEI